MDMTDVLATYVPDCTTLPVSGQSSQNTRLPVFEEKLPRKIF
jgi:hypothetical protein